ncbi:Very-long-chain 3-oxoacyl-CoA synthase [Bertholletia excelsa]
MEFFGNLLPIDLPIIRFIQEAPCSVSCKDLLVACSSTATETICSLNHLLLLVAIALTIAIYCFFSKFSSIYLVDFSCYLPPDHLRVPTAHFIEHFTVGAQFGPETLDFQVKIGKRSGIGCEAAVPPAVHELPPNGALKPTQEETEMVIFTVVKDLLSKHNLNPKSIDILVSNCSIFCSTPSIAAKIINKFGFRSNVKSVNLSGMGCSAGLLSISLAKDLLRVHKNSIALVLSMEAVTPNGYQGTIKSMLLANALFRMGGVAVLLSNRKHDKNKAKYKLQHLVRTHMGSNDQAYQSVFQETDEAGHVGVSLSRALLQVAGNALKTNISCLGPVVLPYSEQILYAWSLLCRKFWTGQKEIYVPNFKKAFEHFCIHAGGKAVIDALEDNLHLSKEDTEASRMTLYRFGNTSSSSIWYELCYLEAKGRVKKGDQVWQIAFGSGFKCNSAVWKCISTISHNERNAWSDRIHLYPVEIPDVLDI